MFNRQPSIEQKPKSARNFNYYLKLQPQANTESL